MVDLFLNPPTDRTARGVLHSFCWQELQTPIQLLYFRVHLKGVLKKIRCGERMSSLAPHLTVATRRQISRTKKTNSARLMYASVQTIAYASRIKRKI